MGNEDSLNTSEEEIEWVSGSSKPKNSRKIVRHRNALEVPLKQIYFNGKTSHCISAHSEGSMALLLHDKTLQVSICVNDMQDEILFGMREVEEFRITRDASLMFKLRPNFNRSYYHHPKGYSFKDRPFPRHSDPTGGKLGGISNVNVKPNYSVDGDEPNLVDELNLLIQTMINRSRGINNRVSGTRKPRNNDFMHNSRSFNSSKIPPIVNIQNDSPSGYTNSNLNDLPREILLPNRYKNAIQKRELYITCIYPTQKRAIVYSYSGIFSHFQFYIRQRFGWKWERMWYRDKTGGWSILSSEDTWASIKRQAINKPIPRIEVFMR